jgi:hypothetical protein
MWNTHMYSPSIAIEFVTTCSWIHCNFSTRWIRRWVIKSKNVGGNHIFKRHNDSATYIYKLERSFGLITFAHILPNALPSHIIATLGHGCKGLRIASGSICCTMTWWSWLLMENNLFRPTCFLNVAEYPIGAWMYITKSRNEMFSSCVNTNGAISLKKCIAPNLLHNHKCCCTPTFSMSFRTSIVSLSSYKYFNKLLDMFRSTCIMSSVFWIGNSYMHEFTSLN